MNSNPAQETVKFTGELDLHSADAAAALLREVWKRSTVVVLDLRGLSFIDSVGLHAVIAADSRHREVGGRLIVLDRPGQVRRFFTLTRARDRLEVIPDPDTGLSAADAVSGTTERRAAEELSRLGLAIEHLPRGCGAAVRAHTGPG